MTNTLAGATVSHLVKMAVSGVLTAMFILLVAGPAAADNCDIFVSPQDCQNTGWTIGIIATAGGAAAAAIAAASKGSPKPKVKKRKFKNCGTASDWLNSGVETGSAATGFTPVLGKPQLAGNNGDGYEVSVDVTWKLNPSKTATVMEVPEWPNMSEADKAAVQEYSDALRAHEEGHHERAIDFMSRNGKTITGEGGTRKEAQADLQRKLDEYMAESKDQLDEVSKSYDETTDHGRNQSAVGGRDVRLNCPPGIS
ncbi:DUF922 domain-containing protein [Arthrobacter sp. 9AX]|uniref:DUF922 domain-containing protein n=1 Tax=Arthrobacter sp. 9AX TaxID=2653131 RepID=UPI001356C042|nr:DUF922 domain-containing protein [Arthrobacter sp. 9AX]